MIFAFLVFSCIFTAFLFSIWNTKDFVNLFIKVYFFLLTVYFGYNAFIHPIFQSLRN